MSNDTKIKQTIFPRDQWERIVNFRYTRRIPSEMAAIRELIDRGLTAMAQDAPAKRAS
jgi:hypothetical protein